MPNATLPSLEEVLRNPSASRWLRVSIQTALDRDPIDVASDARLLSAMLEARADLILSASIADAGLAPVTVAAAPASSATRSLGVDFALPLDEAPGEPTDRPVITHVVREYASVALRSAGRRE